MSEYYISFSDVESFLRCRQQWDFKSANRQSIRHRVTPKLYLSVGTAFHKGIEAGTKGEDPVAATEAYMAEERAAKVAAYEEENGFKPWTRELEDFDEAATLAVGLVRQYFDNYGTDNPLAPEGLTYLGIEIPFKIDISEHFVDLEATVYWIGTIDAVAADSEGNIFLVENKTYSVKPSTEDVQWHYQSMGYASAIEWLTGTCVTGVLYNGVAKKLITEPKVLKNGLLSTDKRQSTTLARYMEAISRSDESADDPRFHDILSHLRGLDEQGDTRFFYREKIFYNREQLESWFNDFLNTIWDMLNSPRIYRTIPFKGCGDCWFRDLCHTTHSGGDVDYILDARYTVGTYGTVDEVKGVEPVSVSSVDELKEFLSNVG